MARRSLKTVQARLFLEKSPMSSRSVLALLLVSSTLAAVGCAADPSESPDDGASTEDALVAKADDEWFYAGPLPALKDAKVTVSLKGHTAHVSGFIDSSVDLRGL